MIVIHWGDEDPKTTDTVTGGPAGTEVGPWAHRYADKPGHYQVKWTSTLKTNTGTSDCLNSTGTLEFTLITAGIYGDFKTISSVTQAARDGWGLLGVVAGRSCVKKVGKTCPPANKACASRSFVQPTGSDLAVERGLSIEASPHYPVWISYWTPAVPAVGTSLFGAGYHAALKAGEDIEAAAGKTIRPSTPLYVTLDFEGSPAEISCGIDAPPHIKQHGDKQCWDWVSSTKARNCWIVSPAGWKQFALGWEQGILASTSPLTLDPAVYVNSSEYKSVPEGGEDVGSWGIPVIIALDPILRKKVQQGPNIVGYAAFNDPTLAPCARAQRYIAEAKTWGGISTIQFSDRNNKHERVNTIYCTP